MIDDDDDDDERGVHWCHLAHMIELSMCVDDVALYQIIYTTCFVTL